VIMARSDTGHVEKDKVNIRERHLQLEGHGYH
jgi:hypothetical protein